MVQCYRWTHKRGGNCALSVLHKTCQWANGKQGTGRGPAQIHLHNPSPNQLNTKERRATEHPWSFVEMLGCPLLENAYRERHPGRQRRIKWEREKENISVVSDEIPNQICYLDFTDWISLITKTIEYKLKEFIMICKDNLIVIVWWVITFLDTEYTEYMSNSDPVCMKNKYLALLWIWLISEAPGLKRGGRGGGRKEGRAVNTAHRARALIPEKKEAQTG